MSTGTLTRLSATEESGPMRTDSTVCIFESRPMVGERFSVVGPPINDHSSARAVITSIVAEIKEADPANPNSITFVTSTGSIYRLDIDPEAQA